jgi:hypothetical protein
LCLHSVSAAVAGAICPFCARAGRATITIGHLRLLGASRTTAQLDAFSELPGRGLVVGSSLATRKLIKACLHIGTQLLPRRVAVLQRSASRTTSLAVW